jgi:hypothetical protein
MKRGLNRKNPPETTASGILVRTAGSIKRAATAHTWTPPFLLRTAAAARNISETHEKMQARYWWDGVLFGGGALQSCKERSEVQLTARLKASRRRLNLNTPHW